MSAVGRDCGPLAAASLSLAKADGFLVHVLHDFLSHLLRLHAHHVQLQVAVHVLPVSAEKLFFNKSLLIMDYRMDYTINDSSEANMVLK